MRFTSGAVPPLAIVLLVLAAALAFASAASYFDDGAYDGEYLTSLNDKDGTGFDEYSENDMENVFDVAEKRGCVRRGGNCDHRPADCCVNSSCRCNLWGANCRCQRRGIFQKWGK